MSMDELLETICDLLDDELERQETALALCRAQGDGLRAQDMAYLQTKTTALELLIQEAHTAEAARNQLLREVTDRYGLSRAAPATLTTLMQAVSDSWRTRLLEYQARMRRVLAQTRAVVRANAGLLRASMDIVGGAMDALEGAASATASHYTPRGTEPVGHHLQPALIDQKG